MTDATQPINPPRRPRAKPYLRLLLIIPSAAILAVGLWGHLTVPPGGTCESIRISTKPGPVGQASEALALIKGTPSLYLKIKTIAGTFSTQPFNDQPIGNGESWPLDRRYNLPDVQDVEVWDHHTIRSDKMLDHIALTGDWSADGQVFRVELVGTKNEPPRWALPTIAVGATLTALVLLRFVWDQVV